MPNGEANLFVSPFFLIAEGLRKCYTESQVMMLMKRLLILLFCILFVLPGGCKKEAETTRYQAEFLSLFDTVTTLVGYADSKENFTEFAEQFKSKLQEYHELYDIYNDYEGVNNIKTINDNAGIAPVEVDQRIISMLLFAKEQYEATAGKVNVAMGAVLNIWHEYRDDGLEEPENAALPPMEELTLAAAHTDINDLVIDASASTVYLRDPLMRLDVGAIAKGYAAEQLAIYFEEQGITSLLFSVGGNVRAIGEKRNEETGEMVPWTIGVQNPDKTSSDTELLNVIISDLSVVSSGVYERYYTVDGVQYHHIIDPETLMPAQYFTAVSILCPDSGLGDALSTAIFNMSLDQGLHLIESIDGTEALWVMQDGSLEYSSGFQFYVDQE